MLTYPPMKPLMALTASVAFIAAALGGLASTAAAATRDITPSVSSNWAGYAISDPATIAGGVSTQPLTFSDVTATWVQPKANCGVSKAAGYSAFWVGLGGFATTSSALEQVGTESDCAEGGIPVYFAWYEIVPAPSVRVDLKIHPGDLITTAVVVNGTDVLVQVKDRTRGVNFIRHLTAPKPDISSAEWIAEAPSQCDSATRCQVLPLANFGSVAFSRIAAIANGHPGTLTDPTWSSLPIQLVPHSNYHSFFGAPDTASRAGATPGSASSDGRTFTVSWLADATLQ
jgi:Peptidase A4 family